VVLSPGLGRSGGDGGSYCTKCGKYLGKSTATLCAACYMVLVYETRAENRDILASIETEEKP